VERTGLAKFDQNLAVVGLRTKLKKGGTFGKERKVSLIPVKRGSSAR